MQGRTIYNKWLHWVPGCQIYNKCVWGVRGIRGEAMHSRICEQVSLESFVEASERFCGADINAELVPPPRCQNREEFELRRSPFARYLCRFPGLRSWTQRTEAYPLIHSVLQAAPYSLEDNHCRSGRRCLLLFEDSDSECYVFSGKRKKKLSSTHEI